MGPISQLRAVGDRVRSIRSLRTLVTQTPKGEKLMQKPKVVFDGRYGWLAVYDGVRFSGFESREHAQEFIDTGIPWSLEMFPERAEQRKAECKPTIH
jgi:hypothetical protein